MTTVAIARTAGEVSLLGGTVTSSVIAYEKGSALTAAKKRISEMTGDNSEANNAHVQAASDLKEIVNIFHMINNYLVDKHSADIVNIKENDGEQKTLKDRISALNECMKDYLNNKKTWKDCNMTKDKGGGEDGKTLDEYVEELMNSHEGGKYKLQEEG